MADPGQGSVESTFKFHSYKVDKFDFVMKQNLQVLALQSLRDVENEISLGIQVPTFFEKENIYISGVSCGVSFFIRKDNSRHNVASLDVNLSGMFSIDGHLDREIESVIVKNQFPTILFPYLRGVVTTFIATSGFGPFIFPLINIPELAEQSLNDSDIEIVKTQQSTDNPEE